MKRPCLIALHALIATVVAVCSVQADDAESLRLVPFPKQVELGADRFRLNRPITIETPDAVKKAAHAFVADELKRAECSDITCSDGSELTVRALAGNGSALGVPNLRPEAGEEGYALTVTPNEIVIVASAVPGLVHGLATLGQLVRANRTDGAIPCVTIHDWPSIRWRAFQDDITRGPSTQLSQLRRDVSRGAMLKMNLFTYYMQHQFAFKKHPLLGPEDGALTADELSALVEYAQPLGVEILGNQQSFAHMQHTLAHPEYAQLKQDDRTLSPVNEGTYKLLDDLYSEVLPILPFEMFNVCCDETWGLGLEGPTKALGDEIGPGGVYVRHIGRVYDLVHGKYGKRMMMWGDVILNHPDKLDAIPKDVVMLTWGYAEKESFEDQIIPFAESGYEFFVCPGVSNWSRVLPHFSTSVTNIQNFVRDGAKHGAIGVLNTSWDDDGENLNAPNWYGFAWGAECAWNASTTSQEDFDRRIGAVMFGERGGDFGRAIELLSTPGLCGMTNRQFWEATTGLVREDVAEAAEANLKVVREAIERLTACQQVATVDGDLLDSLLFGARRMEHYFQCQIDRVAAASAYDHALEGKGEEAVAQLTKADEAIGHMEERFCQLRDEWQTLWFRENKPHALDWSLARYNDAVTRCRDSRARLGEAREAVEAGRPLPPATDVGLRLWRRPKQLVRPGRVESSLGNYQDYYPEFAFDGNPETFYWSDRGLAAGDHFTLVLNEPVELKRVKFLFGTDRYRNEFIHNGVLEVQDEAGGWTKLADLRSLEPEVQLPSVKIKAVRVRATDPQRFWLIVREIEVE